MWQLIKECLTSKKGKIITLVKKENMCLKEIKKQLSVLLIKRKKRRRGLLGRN